MNDKLGEPWQIKSLEEVSTFRRGSFPQPYGNPEWYDDNGYPFVQVYDINQNNKLNSRTKSRISEEASKKSVFIEKGSLIVSIQGSIGRVAITQYDAFVDRTILIFNDFEKYLDKQFFLLIIKELFLRQGEIADGGVIKTITKQTLKNFKIKIPPLPEQKKIAEILNGVDTVISEISVMSNRINLLIKLLRTNIIKEKSKVSPSKRIDEVATNVFDGPHITPNYVKSGVPFVTVKNITTGKLDLTKTKFITEKDYEIFSKRGCAEEGDILYSKDGSIGHTAIVPPKSKFGFFVSVALLKTNKQIINSQYLDIVLKSDFCKEQTELMSEGSGLKHMVLKNIKGLVVPLPPLKDQEVVVNLISPLSDLHEKLEIKMQKLVLLKKGLISDLLSGRKRLEV